MNISKSKIFRVEESEGNITGAKKSRGSHECAKCQLKLMNVWKILFTN